MSLTDLIKKLDYVALRCAFFAQYRAPTFQPIFLKVISRNGFFALLTGTYARFST